MDVETSDCLVSAFLHGEKPGYEAFPPTDTHLSIVFSPPPPSFLSITFFISLVNSCSEYCALLNVTPESHQTLASLSGTLSRLKSYSISGLNQYVFVFQLFAHFPSSSFLVSIPARVSQRVVRVHA